MLKGGSYIAPLAKKPLLEELAIYPRSYGISRSCLPGIEKVETRGCGIPMRCPSRRSRSLPPFNPRIAASVSRVIMYILVRVIQTSASTTKKIGDAGKINLLRSILMLELTLRALIVAMSIEHVVH